MLNIRIWGKYSGANLTAICARSPWPLDKRSSLGTNAQVLFEIRCQTGCQVYASDPSTLGDQTGKLMLQDSLGYTVELCLKMEWEERRKEKCEKNKGVFLPARQVRDSEGLVISKVNFLFSLILNKLKIGMIGTGL